VGNLWSWQLLLCGDYDRTACDDLTNDAGITDAGELVAAKDLVAAKLQLYRHRLNKPDR
jgi:hypothetical protein